MDHLSMGHGRGGEIDGKGAADRIILRHPSVAAFFSLVLHV